MTKHELWLKASDLFLVNDGSLPEISFKGLTIDKVSTAYDFLRRLADRFECNTYYWSLPEQRDMQVQSHDKAEEILAVAEAKYFHVVISDVYSPSGIAIPPLGISVFEDWISLDYRMGGDWNSDALHGFFEIICALQNLTMAPEISHEENQNDPSGHRFLQALSDFKNSRDNMADFYSRPFLLLSLQRALLGEVRPALRQASIEADRASQTVRLRFEYDSSPDFGNDSCAAVASEVMADFPEDWRLDEQHQATPAPSPLAPLAHVAYRRAELEHTSPRA